jgi:hypothetical protein
MLFTAAGGLQMASRQAVRDTSLLPDCSKPARRQLWQQQCPPQQRLTVAYMIEQREDPSPSLRPSPVTAAPATTALDGAAAAAASTRGRLLPLRRCAAASRSAWAAAAATSRCSCRLSLYAAYSSTVQLPNRSRSTSAAPCEVQAGGSGEAG